MDLSHFLGPLNVVSSMCSWSNHEQEHTIQYADTVCFPLYVVLSERAESEQEEHNIQEGDTGLFSSSLFSLCELRKTQSEQEEEYSVQNGDTVCSSFSVCHSSKGFQGARCTFIHITISRWDTGMIQE